MPIEAEKRKGERRVSGTPRNGRVSYREVLDWIVRGMIGLLVLITSLAFGKLNDLNQSLTDMAVRVTAIESSRFTIADGASLQRQLDSKPDRQELQDRLTRIEDLLLEALIVRRSEERSQP